MKKRWMSGVLALILAGTSAAALAPAYKVQADTQGTTYYVSSKNGDDANSGTSKEEAYQTLSQINKLTLEPGDQVLLEKGSVFEDQWLHVQGSGSEEAPIIISTYGEGERPVINTNGQGHWELNYGKHLDNTNHKWHGTVSSTILLKDVEYSR